MDYSLQGLKDLDTAKHSTTAYFLWGHTGFISLDLFVIISVVLVVTLVKGP